MSARAVARAWGLWGVKRVPSTPGVMRSVKAPWLAATGGTPRAMASMATRPKGSAQAEGRMTAREVAMRWAHWAGVAWPARWISGRVAAQVVISGPRVPAPAMVRWRAGLGVVFW